MSLLESSRFAITSGSQALTNIPRRYLTFGILIFLAMILFSQFRSHALIHETAILRDIPYERPMRPENDHYQWVDRRQHFPLDSFSQLPTGPFKSLPTIQHKFPPETPTARQARLERRDQIKHVFQKCWNSYRKKAWMYDELLPVSGNATDTFGGWAATLIDALDTLWIMDMRNDFYEAAAATKSIYWAASTDETINIFETTIRHLGGLLAAYDLSCERSLLDVAFQVGEMLLVAFDTPNHLPITRWEWRKAAAGERQETPSSMLVSELGSLSLEFTRLSQLTGDSRFYDAIKRITDLFDDQQSQTKLPGMWPVVVNPQDQDLVSDTSFTLGGMSDSLYEYFPKQYALLGGHEPVYQKLYEQSMETAINSLFFRPMTPNGDDILLSGDVRAALDGSSITLEPKGQHLACFTGGMLALGGRLFNKPDHLAIARKLTEGCIWAYHAMQRGIMPEVAFFVPCEDKSSCTWEESKWLEGVMKRHSDSPELTAQAIVKQKNLPQGYISIDDKRYILRPEAIESVFYMWRTTGDEKYREDAWKMWTAINEVTDTLFASAAIIDVTVARPDMPPQDDRMESFWFAETLKYFYLIFSEPELISLDDYILNTEAHPFKRQK